VLRHVVELIQSRIRTSDCFARWGGEEFMLLLPSTQLAAARSLADALLEELQGTQVEGVGSVTASFGVTSYRPGDTVDLLTQRADTLMYAAKQAGRNCVRADSL
jgi:diguanylate cyclase (GGDEF)-like protein